MPMNVPLSARRLLISLILMSAVETARAQDIDTLPGGVSPPTSEAIGSYNAGCLAGGVGLEATGAGWQTLFPDRDRSWGHPSLISYLERLAAVAARDGWPGLLIGDLSQRRGGPMSSGHVSHQNGLDADIWYVGRPAIDAAASLADLSAISLITPGTNELDEDKWSEALAQLIRQAASDFRVSRIFVHPRIKERLCEASGSGRSWLQVIRPWHGHDDHFHVRLKCPDNYANCVPQAPPPPGEGCGPELAIWFGPNAPRAESQPTKTLQDLPKACTVLLTEP